MKNNKSAFSLPKLRFKGFEGKWEKKKLGDVVEIYGPGVDKIIRENEKIGFMVNFMDVYKNKIIDNNIQLSKTSFSFDEFKKYKIYFNDLLITPSSENKEEIGITSIIKFNYNAVYSYHLNLIRCSDTCFPDFLNIHFETNAIRKYFYAISQGVSRYTLKKSDFLNLQILYPSLPEQQKIAHFFTLLDKRIELVENKLKLYELKKKYFLNKLFCGDDQLFPKLRFKGFEGKWEKKKLGDVGEVYSGLTSLKSSNFNKGNDFYITYLEVYQKKKLNNNSGERVFLNDTQQNKVHKFDILVTMSSETQTDIGITNIYLGECKKYLNSFCFIFRILSSKKEYQPFINILLSTKKYRKKIIGLGQGSTRFNLSKKRFLKLEIVTTSFLPEQQKIANFFTLLDKKMELINKKLSILKKHKNYYMNNLFI